MPQKSKLIVIALGGNALNSPRGRGDYFEQLQNAEKAAKEIVKIINKGYKVVITHGNGPQVGNILLQQEYSKDYVAPLPLSVCGAESQGQIGTILSQAINNELKKKEIKARAIAIVTHVLVDKKDPAFQNPTKPIGPVYTPNEAKKLKKEEKIFKEIQIGAFRRVVPSPKPLEILEIEAIRGLLNANLIPIAVGGGGIPVVKKHRGIKLVDAVIDKDLASALLAYQLKADEFIILTDVPKVAINFGKKGQKWLDKLTLAQAKQYMAQGYFPSGSMGPKIKAAIEFIEKGGKKAVICHLRDLTLALAKKTGTQIIKNAKTKN